MGSAFTFTHVTGYRLYWQPMTTVRDCVSAFVRDTQMRISDEGAQGLSTFVTVRPLDHFKETSGHFPAMFVAIKEGFLDEMLNQNSDSKSEQNAESRDHFSRAHHNL